MEGKDRGKAYTMSFIERHGGTEEVARNTGLNRQTVRQVATGRNYPGFDFIARLTETYPDYDLKEAFVRHKSHSTVGINEGYSDEDTQDQDDDQDKVSLDPMAVRLLDFVKQKGGPSEVARHIGLNQPAVFNNYKSGRNKQPASEILQKLAENYFDFDPSYILTGRYRSINQDATSPVKDAQIDGLRREVVRLEETVSILRSVVGSQLGKDMESKTESADGANQGKQMVIGLGLSKRQNRRFISLSMRDATGTSRFYDNPAPIYSPRR